LNSSQTGLKKAGKRRFFLLELHQNWGRIEAQVLKITIGNASLSA